MKQVHHVQTILFVQDQEASADFYTKLFRQEPDLHVPGMTEFILTDTCKLGLMPNRGIAKILAGKTLHPEQGIGIPRCELYLRVENINLEFDNALKAGAKLISPIENRDWGDKACYVADPDGNVIAFAEPLTLPR